MLSVNLFDFTLPIYSCCITSFTIFSLCSCSSCFYCQLPTFQLLFKHIFVVIMVLLVLDFGVWLLSLISLHTSEQNVMYHQKCTCNFIIITTILRDFTVVELVQNFVWFSKRETGVSEQNSLYFFVGDSRTCFVCVSEWALLIWRI